MGILTKRFNFISVKSIKNTGVQMKVQGQKQYKSQTIWINGVF